MKKILLIGGTGALGVYLTEETVRMGYDVTVLSMDDMTSDIDNLHYVQHNAQDLEFMKEFVKNGYDAIVDFMIYKTVDDCKPFADLYLNNTEHYVFLSSYRVYSGEYPITEETPRLLDIEKPADFVCPGEYSIYKAEQEDYIRSTGKKNWTFLRPSITYSKRRFQLTILEAHTFIWRMLNGKTVVLPESAMDAQGTLSWAGDFGKAVARLLFNPKAYCEAFTVGTAEHYTWREIAEIYKKIGGLKYITVDDDTFVNEVLRGNVYTRQQLTYDRCFNRVIDNTKLLNATGLKQEDFMPLEKGLAMELASYENNFRHPWYDKFMDEYLEKHGLE